MSSRPPAMVSARPLPAWRRSTVVRARRSCAASSCDSAASSAGAARFMALGREPEAREQLAIARHVGVAGGEQFLAVENGVRAREETQRLQLIAHRLAP